ncbi:VOC family protein [Phenylobacterium sp. LH3H17]|uniref:VOC family protein n=1 Tax=Phenylobacterium sp. LH3H17 TaxID=2903901 RepID=UPI0020C9C86D|nr:VOC family protein [Phenylobacterium sp. LH3H17]UTP38276.1 VOC family protein [Phenylobacterium sp. LH3H17]
MRTGIDHLVSLVEDLERARAAARRLGFQITERGVHPGRGTVNSLIMLPDCYWELLALSEPRPQNLTYRNQLARRGGLAGCAFATDDLARSRARAALDGVRLGEGVEISRPVSFGDEEDVARFQIADARVAAPFEAFFFFCNQRTPDLVWRSEWLDHPNGAVAISALHVVFDEDEAVVRELAAMADGAVASKETGFVVTSSHLPRIHCLSPQNFQLMFPGSGPGPRNPHIAAMEVRVRDLRRTRDLLDRAGVPTQANADRVWVARPDLGEGLIVFAETP